MLRHCLFIDLLLHCMLLLLETAVFTAPPGAVTIAAGDSLIDY